MEKFSLKTMKVIYEEESVEAYKLKQLKSYAYNRTKDYIKDHIYHLDEGDYIVDGVIVGEKGFNKKVNHFPKVIKKWFLTDYDEFKKPVLKFEHHKIQDDEYNLLPKGKHTKKAFKKMPKTLQKKALKFINKYIKPVLCNNDELIFDYFMKWLAKMIQEHKNTTMIVLKGPEGCGKSTLSKMICSHILGLGRTIKASSTPLTSKFNIELMGKQFVYFEELRSGTKSEQELASSTLKDLVTNAYANYEAKNKNQLENILNISNFMSFSNNYYAIKDNQGRRYFILDIDTSYMSNFKYWKIIHDELLNDDVGEALFNYFNEIDITDYNEFIMPLTENKISAFIKSYSPSINYIRENYLFCNKGMVIKTNDLYAEFCMKTNPKFQCKKTYFYDNLKHFGLTYKKTNGFNKYVYTNDELHTLAEKRKWHFKEQAENHDQTEDTNEHITDSDLKINRLLESQKIIMKYLQEKSPDHYENIMNILNSNPDLKATPQTITHEPENPKKTIKKIINKKQKENTEKYKKKYSKSKKDSYIQDMENDDLGIF